MTYYVVTAGLTRRLVEADTPADAETAFLLDSPRRGLVAHEAILTRPAHETEIAEFKRRKAKFDGQLALDVGAAGLKRPKKRGASAKEHA